MVVSATIDTMTVVQARAVLENTRGLSAEQVDEAQRVMNTFHASRPRKACVACGSMIWSEHDGGAWACDRCHRSADLTTEDWHAQETARREAADEHLAAVTAAAPKPRDVLKQALAKLTEARNALAQHERAVPIARSAATEAQARHDRAVEAAEAVNATSAENLAVAFFEGTKPTDPARAAAAARGELAAAVDALVIAKNARTILNSKLKDAHASVGYASDRARKAARGVISAELLEPTLAEATESRAGTSNRLVGWVGWSRATRFRMAMGTAPSAFGGNGYATLKVARGRNGRH